MLCNRAGARRGFDEGIACGGSSLRDLLAVTLAQLGYAVVPPRDAQAVAALLAAAGLLPHEQGLYASGDLEDWQPYLVTARLTPKGCATQTMSQTANVP